MVCGEPVREYLEIMATGSGKVNPAPEPAVMPRAACVAFLGLELFQAGLAVSAADLNPLYVRRAEAEELWEKRCGGRT
jgi:tRNA threonylcarbamoyladenosine biosynthesis protein TsaB